jgi:hypothetical protein
VTDEHSVLAPMTRGSSAVSSENGAAVPFGGVNDVWPLAKSRSDRIAIVASRSRAARVVAEQDPALTGQSLTLRLGFLERVGSEPEPPAVVNDTRAGGAMSRTGKWESATAVCIAAQPRSLFSKSSCACRLRVIQSPHACRPGPFV